MTPAQITSYIRNILTSTNSTTFSDADLKLILEVIMDQLARRIMMEVDEDWFGVPATHSLVADQREYPLLTDMLMGKIKFVEAKLDGTNWIPLREFDLKDYDRTTDESAIVANFSNEKRKAFFDIFRGSLWIYSGTITAVTAGLKMWGFSYPDAISDLTSTTDLSVNPTATGHGFPKAFHKLICVGVSREWKQGRRKPLPLSEVESSWEKDINFEIEAMKNLNLDRQTIGTVPALHDEDSEDLTGENY